MQLDVAQFECIREFVHEFLAKDERLDILVISMPRYPKHQSIWYHIMLI